MISEFDLGDLSVLLGPGLGEAVRVEVERIFHAVGPASRGLQAVPVRARRHDRRDSARLVLQAGTVLPSMASELRKS